MRNFWLLAAFSIEIVTRDLPRAVLDEPYLPEALAVTGGARCTTSHLFTRVVLGELPPGIDLSATGYLRGIPTRAGDYLFVVRAGNDCGYGTRTFRLTVSEPPRLQVSPASLVFVAQNGGGAQPEPQPFLVTASEGNLPYLLELDQDATWLELHPLRGRTPSAGPGDPVTVMVRPGKLGPGKYSTRVRVVGFGVVDTPVVMVTLQVN